MSHITSSLALLVLLAVASANQITSIPGYDGSIPFKQYSGYITVDKAHNRNLFYWFVESQKDPANDPVVLWLNGGPGCSSLDGFLSEHGPFHIDNNGTIYLNPYSWNTVANVIYLEAPAGVGFSYSDDPRDYHTNDNKTAEDNYRFLLGFFEQYPEFSSNDFYIAGESYAGHYVPELVYTIINGNKAGNPPINLVGFLAGNPATDANFDGNSYIEFICGHGLVSAENIAALRANCPNGVYFGNVTDECISAVNDAIKTIGDINPYDIYLPCYHPGADEDELATALRNHRRSVPSEVQPFVALANVPCINATAETLWLNQPDVKAALSANPNITWEICSNTLHYDIDVSTVLPLYPYILENVKHAVAYSGDVDSVVNYMGTQAWVASLGYPITSAWRPWHYENQVAGHVIEYSEIWFVTVMGAGHMVPEWKPPQALHFFSHFIAGKSPK